jgi:RNA polymerase sigma-70 factor, ECF subfamily
MFRLVSQKQGLSLPATSELFERHGALVYARCRRILGEHEAADAVQEVFMKVVQNRAQYRGDSSASTWLYGIATLHCLQVLRNRERRRDKLADAADLWPKDTGPATADEQIGLRRLLEEQSDELRLMVYLRCVDELTVDEVAAVVGRSRKTVGKHVSQFLQTARVILGPSVAGGSP